MPEPTAPNREREPLSVFAEEFLRVSRRHLDERRQRIETCVSKLNQQQIWSRQHENENAVGNLILHLCGNLRQWIISGVGGAPNDRDRDAEFARRDPIPTLDLLGLLRDTLREADEVLAKLQPADLLAKRRIQAYDVTVLHAVYHVVEHFGQHTGQIIWITKWLTGEDLGFYRYLQDKKTAPGKEP